MSQNYNDWANLNEEGLKEFGDIFPNGIVPIIGMIPFTFDSPNLTEPEQGYLLRGSDLTQDQITKLVDKLAKKFNDEGKKEEIKKAVLSNDIPVRRKLTSGTGTKRIYMYMADDMDDDEEDWDDDEDGNDDWSIEDQWQEEESRFTSEKRSSLNGLTRHTSLA